MNKYRGTVKTSMGERNVEVRARDVNHAKSLLESHGKLLYNPKMIPG